MTFLAPALALLVTAPAAGAADPAAAAVGSGAPSRWSATAGWGFYEVVHVGASYRTSERGAVALFGGFGFGDDQDATVGVAYSHALYRPVWTVQPGVALKGIYWTQSDPYYDWRNLTLVLGPSLTRALGKGFSLALDGGVAFTTVLESDRKQNFTFGNPRRWNGSLCLEVSYRVGAL